MSESSTSGVRCTQCGSVLQDVPGSLCPRCLMAEIIEPTVVMDAPARNHAPLAPEEIAPHFPQLEIGECLGRGGMGVVYKARQKSLNRPVALKLLAPECAGDAGFADRFAKEAQALAALSHPNIVAVHDFGEAGGFFYLLMEFVDGVNLRQLLQLRRLTPQEALSIVPPICDALQCAHARGIVHRDIKPENLLLDRTGAVKIADFGIAKLVGAAERTQAEQARPTGAPLGAGTLVGGTPQYAAPEQRSGETATDHRADIYSLGVVLYEMLTGERPAQKPEPPSRLVQVDIRLDEIVLRALEKSPELRYGTVAEFRTRVDEVRAGPLVNSFWTPARKAAAAIAACLLVAGVAYTLTQDNEPQEGSGGSSLNENSAPVAETLDAAVAQLEASYSALLDAEREQALDLADPSPPDARRGALYRERTLRIAELRRRVQQIEQRILALSKNKPNPNTQH